MTEIIRLMLPAIGRLATPKCSWNLLPSPEAKMTNNKLFNVPEPRLLELELLDNCPRNSLEFFLARVSGRNYSFNVAASGEAEPNFRSEGMNFRVND